MIRNRVIPLLLFMNGGLVKSKKFKNHVYVGDPINTIKIFNTKEVDELIFIDIDASKLNREPNYKLISEIASECFMPLTYGGGVKNIEQARKIFSLGVEKISFQSSVIDNMDFITELAKEFGSQSIVISIDVKKSLFGNYLLYNASTKTKLKINLTDYIKNVEIAGAGEILVNSVDNDGVMSGLDTKLIELVSHDVNIPIIASGGIGSLKNIKEGIDSGADAVAAGSFFVFKGSHNAVLISYPKYSELQKLLEN
ncbi:AglZ/HisF2 family acetamidino modification protein [Photobacterium leiognathi]|uniref:AglZ/HisF2 family acetamidino modification protein n=1 Tax=Photobacterium leiognathi TaxID=553611 RepID=UPI002981C1D7|nr:AglZ/HisF2 family acetamidino modification protein [Photobacterium leiognathi]